MNKILFIIPLFTFCVTFADTLSPENYRNQVINDCLAVNNTLTSLTQQGGQIDDLQSYINTIWINVAYDNNIPQSSKDFIVPYCQQAYYGLDSVQSTLEALQQQNISIYNTARNLQIDSVSGGSSVTNNYYYTSSTTNIYNNSSSNFYNSFTTNNYYTTDNNFYNTSVTNLSFYSSFTTNISNYTQVDLTSVLSYLQSLEGLDSTLVSNFSAFLSSYTNFLSSIGTLSSDIATLRSDISSIGSTVSELNDWFQWYSSEALTYLVTISLSVSNIESYFYGVSQKITSINSILNSILTILPTWASRSIMFYDSMSSWTNRFWNIGNALYPVLKTSIVGVSSLSPSGWLAYETNQHLNYDYTFYDLFSNFFCREYPLFASVIADYCQTNTIALSTIARNTSSFDVSSITNEIRRQFSIFNVDSPLMDFYNPTGNTTNQYYNFLTNYYIKVSTGHFSGSASESHTNWFSRIEMLLGALVFKDSSEGSFSRGSTNIDSVENAYDSFSQSLSTAVELPSSFQAKIENAEQSILDYMRQWHSIISSASLGSHFTLCDVTLSGFDSDTQNSSSFDGRLNLSVPIDGALKNFLDLSRSVSTVCFITLFLILSLKLLIFLLRACASITRVCYALFMAIAGH